MATARTNGGVMAVTVAEALAAWGACDQDDPFTLFASVRELSAVHPVTLADGHGAWLVSGNEQARTALKDPRLSKDMRAAMATDSGVVSEGLSGPAFARHMLSVDPPGHTRLRLLVAAAFLPAGSRGCGPGCRPSRMTSWTASPPGRSPTWARRSQRAWRDDDARAAK